MTARRRRRCRGSCARSEGQDPTGDADVDAAYDGAGAVYDFYFDIFGRDSIDGQGMPLVSTVHHRRNYNNAFWNGTQMAYGDGDGQIFSTFIETSVIGHEMSHGVVQFSGGLEYEGQSGALNESFADVFGTMVRQCAEKTSACESDWLIGKGILGPEIQGVALRSMKMPGTAYSDALLGQDPQPYHMDLYVNTTEDNGGVHINSGIPEPRLLSLLHADGRQRLGGAGADLVPDHAAAQQSLRELHRLGDRHGAGGAGDLWRRLARGDGGAAGVEAGGDFGLRMGGAAECLAMMITISTSGGIGGFGLAKSAEVAVDNLPEPLRVEACARLDAETLASLDPTPVRGAADRIVYHIVVIGRHGHGQLRPAGDRRCPRKRST